MLCKHEAVGSIPSSSTSFDLLDLFSLEKQIPVLPVTGLQITPAHELPVYL